MRKTKILWGTLFSVSAMLSAQQPHYYFDNNLDFKKAEQLYLTETYLAAQYEFENVLSQPNRDKMTREAAEYYAALTGIINDQKGAEEKLMAFKENYPRSIFSENGAWELGSYYLRKGEYDKAYQYLTQNSLDNLPERKKNEYQFKLGYVNFMRGNETEALRLLEPLIQSEKYSEPSLYYVGHIYYSEKNYDKAFEYFNELQEENPDYREKVLPYLVQIEFNKGEYEKVIEDGKTLLNQTKDSFLISEVSKIIGESYFNLGEYALALPYLESYKGEKTNADNYQLGYAYYQKGDYDKAVNYFNKIVESDNAFAQTAYYQLGNAYLRTDKKQEALSAFQSASQMNFDTAIQRDAFYNYAKLSYENGNPFEGVSEVIQTFIQKYPNSPYKNEMETLLIDSYLSSGNYKDALKTLQSIPYKNSNQKKAEQTAAFLYGSSLFTQGEFSQALPYFTLASSHSENPSIKAQSYFWQGETYYAMGQYQKALEAFNNSEKVNTSFPEKKEIEYQKGYTYLKLREYNQAVNAFNTYLQTNPPGEFKPDAKLRLADAYMGTQNTTQALKLYGEVADESVSQSPEAAYNFAIVQGVMGNNKEKIRRLEAFLVDYPVSTFTDRAQLQLADALIREQNYVRAEKHLNDLIKGGNDEMEARARLKKGAMLYNRSNNNDALVEFKYVAEGYPNTALALQAIENAKRIYLEKGNIEGFENWAKGLSYYEVDENELQQLAWEQAQEPFNNGDYALAIPKLESFYNRYPNSVYKNKVAYEIGESYYQTSDYNQAIPFLTEAAKSNSPQQEDALLRLCQIYLNENQQTEALLALEALYSVSENEAYKSFAEIHLMRIYSERNQTKKALEMAEKVEANSKNEESIKQEAQLTVARSLFQQKKYDQAQSAFALLENAKSAAVKAEALYYKTWFLNRDKKYKASNEVIFDLAGKYSDQQYWGSKALIIMAKNYYELQDVYQATYTLNKVIENYPEYPEVTQEAQELLNEIKEN